MTLATSVSKIRALGPCAGGYRFALGKLADKEEVSAAEARKAGCSFEDMAWYLSVQARNDAEIDRRLRMWKADVAARVLPVFEMAFPEETCARDAIVAARAYAAGEIDLIALQQAIAAAQMAEDMAWMLNAIRAAQACSAARVCGDTRASWVVSRCAVEAVREQAGAELGWQYDKLVEWFSHPEPKPIPLSERHGGNA